MKSIFIFIFILLTGSTAFSATFQSKASGNFYSLGTWSVTIGSDADGKPDADDDIIIKAGHIVTLTGTTYANSMTILTSGVLRANARRLYLTGDLFMAGTITNGIVLYFADNVAVGNVYTITTPNQAYNATGDIFVSRCQVKLPAGSTIAKQGTISLLDSASFLNQGSVTLNNQTTTANLGALKLLGRIATWINDVNAYLGTASASSTYSSAVMNASAVNNTVAISNINNIIIPTTYYNLEVNSSVVKTLTNDVTVLNQLTMGVSTTNRLILNGHTLNVGGNLILDAVINGLTAGSTLNFTGSGVTQTVSGAKTFSVQNLGINAPGATINFSTTTIQNWVFNTLTLTDGNFNANSKLILASTPLTTARIAPVTGGAFTGNINMQKFLDASNAKWFDLSSPATNSTVNDWDNEMYISGIGPYDGIGGPQGVDGDVKSSSNTTFNYAKSMHTYDEPTAAYIDVTGSTTPLIPGMGYDLWFEDEVNDQWKAKTINTIGIPNTGDITLNLSYTGSISPYDGYHLIGNPYASAIDLNLIYDDFFGSSTYYNNMDEYDVEVLDGTNTGGFSLIDATTPGAIIYPHQGFWVRTTAPGATFTFHENCKVTDLTTAINQRKAVNYDIKLLFTSPTTTTFYGENVINFNNLASVNFERQYDHGFRYSPITDAPALFMNDVTGKKMMKNTIDNTLEEVVLPLGLYTPKSAVYYIEASVLNMDSYNYAWIENIKTGKQFDLNANSIAIEGEEGKTNTDYVLHLSKTKKSSAISSTLLESDLVIFNTENTINLKSESSAHNLNELNIYDMTGKLVLSEKNVNVELGTITKIDVSFLSKGVYVVNAIDKNGRSITKKVIK